MVYALGGIRRNKIGYLMDTGFDGVALLGSIWGKPNPVHAFKEFAPRLILCLSVEGRILKRLRLPMNLNP